MFLWLEGRVYRKRREWEGEAQPAQRGLEYTTPHPKKLGLDPEDAGEPGTSLSRPAAPSQVCVKGQNTGWRVGKAWTGGFSQEMLPKTEAQSGQEEAGLKEKLQNSIRSAGRSRSIRVLGVKRDRGKGERRGSWPCEDSGVLGSEREE